MTSGSGVCEEHFLRPSMCQPNEEACDNIFDITLYLTVLDMGANTSNYLYKNMTNIYKTFRRPTTYR